MESVSGVSMQSTGDGEADDEGSQASNRTKAKRRHPPLEKAPGRHLKGGWKAPVHTKTAEQAASLREVVSTSFLFEDLTNKELRQVMQALRGPHHVLQGMEVIRQGMLVEGDEPALYLVEKGKLAAFVRRKDSPHPGYKVHTYDRIGRFFGELALVFKCPRSATVVAQSESTLWSLDRESFNQLVKESYLALRERYATCLDRTGFSAKLRSDEIAMILDGMEMRMHEGGQVIARLRKTVDDQERHVHDEPFHELFIVETGHAVASHTTNSDTQTYEPADVFGAPLSAVNCDVTAGESPTVCAVLDVNAMEMQLGPLSQLFPDAFPAITNSLATPPISPSPTPRDYIGGETPPSNVAVAEEIKVPSSVSETRRGFLGAWWPEVLCECSRPPSCYGSRSRGTDLEAWSEAVQVLDDDDA